MKTGNYIAFTITVISLTLIILMFVYVPSNNGLPILNSNESYVYTPSNITKANSEITATPAHIMSATNIHEVANEVIYTIQGVILDVGDIIDVPATDDQSNYFGAIPITMSVDNVYKGNIDSDTFTFLLGSRILYIPKDLTSTTTTSRIESIVDENKVYLMFPWEPHFEVGDHVIVHITESYFDEKELMGHKDRKLLDPYYQVLLGESGAYKIQDNMAYNKKFPNGISLKLVSKESLTWP